MCSQTVLGFLADIQGKLGHEETHHVDVLLMATPRIAECHSDHTYSRNTTGAEQV
jgi:hypothetical protein